MSIQAIITALTAEMEKHPPVYRPYFNEAILQLERVIANERDWEHHTHHYPTFKQP